MIIDVFIESSCYPVGCDLPIWGWEKVFIK